MVKDVSLIHTSHQVSELTLSRNNVFEITLTICLKVNIGKQHIPYMYKFPESVPEVLANRISVRQKD